MTPSDAAPITDRRRLSSPERVRRDATRNRRPLISPHHSQSRPHTAESVWRRIRPGAPCLRPARVERPLDGRRLSRHDGLRASAP